MTDPEIPSNCNQLHNDAGTAADLAKLPEGTRIWWRAKHTLMYDQGWVHHLANGMVRIGNWHNDPGGRYKGADEIDWRRY